MIDPAVRREAVRLRLHGCSYAAIVRRLGLKSQGTLSEWFRDLQLPAEAQQRLRKNNERAAQRGFFQFNSNRTIRIHKENAFAFEQGVQDIGALSQRELSLVGAALFWGEGKKWERSSGSPALVFTNSDPAMIQLFMRFLREVLVVTEDRIRAGIHLYDRGKITASRKYWSGVTKLPQDRFYISTLVGRASGGKRDKNRLPYGTLVLRVNSRTAFHRMKGMIAGLAGKRVK